MTLSDEQVRRLATLYKTPSEPGALRGIKGLQDIARRHVGPISDDEARRILQNINAYTLHGRVVKGAANLTERIVASSAYDMWECDLLDAPHVREQEGRDQYLLVVVDAYTKYAMVRVIPTKDARTVCAALLDLITAYVPPYARLNALRTDFGREFDNAVCHREVYEALGINWYPAQKEPGAAIVERLNRTLATAMTKYVTANPRTTQSGLLGMVQDFVDSYNNTVHTATRQTPASLQAHAFKRGSTSGLDILRDVAAGGSGAVTDNPAEEDKDTAQVLAGVYQSTSLGRNKKPHSWDPVTGPRLDRPIEVGTHVRLLKRPDIFRKGSRQKAFTDEVFTVTRRSRNNANAYYVADESGQELKGRVYRRQLQELTSRPDRWEVRVLRRRKSTKKGRRGQLELLVEWVGYPGRPAEWIPASDASDSL